MNPIEKNDLKWIAIDLDQTIADTKYPKFKLNEPMAGAVKYMNKIVEDGWKPVIYTARGWSQYAEVETWLDTNKIPYKKIICGKPLFRWIIDDKNIEFRGDWGDAYGKIE